MIPNGQELGLRIPVVPCSNPMNLPALGRVALVPNRRPLLSFLIKTL